MTLVLYAARGSQSADMEAADALVNSLALALGSVTLSTCEPALL
jgi:hypothetical protein